MSYVVEGLSPVPFQALYGLTEAQLREAGAVRYAVDAPVGYPCRVDLADAPVGAAVLLVNYLHQPADTPYRASHAIFVREGAEVAARFKDEIPPALRVRPFISLRAFTPDGMMTDAAIAPGEGLEPQIERLLADPAVAYLQAHYAARGCYAARIVRA
jgi:hypothetical protein